MGQKDKSNGYKTPQQNILCQKLLHSMLTISVKFHEKLSKTVVAACITMLIFEFVLMFNCPVNPMGSCQARSVYLTTRLVL